MTIRMFAIIAGLGLATVQSAAAQSLQSKTHVAGKPSSMLTLNAEAPSPGDLGGFSVIYPDGSLGGALSIPEGSVFVLTDIQIQTGFPGPGPRSGGVCVGPGGSCDSFVLFFGFDGPMQHIALTGGIVFSATPQVYVDTASAGGIYVRAFGYLAKNK